MECVDVLQTASTTAAHGSSSTGFQMMLACECSAHSGAWWYVHVLVNMTRLT